ncbi:DUF2779 domain-containing protein [Leptospira levettii]|uniref:DUF2779 domain-containing protein n=1 Tax=Leptospira levettii TaxID=2023178 RepID=UPI003EBBD83B
MKTKRWIDEGNRTIYEASFFHDETLSALDIFHREGHEIWAIEVKSSTSVKDYHLVDASLQYWVMTNAGYPPDKFFLMHIDNSYIRRGEIDSKQLFTLTDITTEVKSKFDWVGENLHRLKSIQKDREPLIEIGNHCLSPFECDYIHHCWKHIPQENSVFELTNARGKSWKLYEENILHLADIPEDFPLTKKQKIQVDGVKYNQSNIEIESIREFLSSWKFPLYFFDFETIFPAIPILQNTSPFQQIPFQYSLHVINEPNGILEHKEFLAEPSHFGSHSEIDPRLKLLEQMRIDLGDSGSIVAYNASFEKNVLKDLSIAYPQYSEWINSAISRFVDLYEVFRNGWFYAPKMGNSASIKSVLPALAPEFSYNDLEISNGGDASNTFIAMMEGSLNGKVDSKRKDLLKYCERDTLGMVIIWQKLQEFLER